MIFGFFVFLFFLFFCCWCFCSPRWRSGLAPARRGWCFLLFAAHAVWLACVCAGIRVLPSCFKRRPCAGRHLLFFAAAKKSRQKKAAHTASTCSYPRAPNVPALHTAVPWLVFVANASNERFTHFKYPCSGQRQRMVYAAQVANCVQVVAPHRLVLLPETPILLPSPE